MTENAFALEHRPTWRERLAKRLGFRFMLGDEPVGTDGWEGWARTNLRMHFSIADRVRILISGRLNANLTHYTDKRFDEMRTRTDLHIPPPWA